MSVVSKLKQLIPGPFIVPALSASTGGVDFLGLRQVNLDLTTHCIPGIGNRTVHVRPFALLAWIHWKFHGEMKRAGRSSATDRELQIFQEKAETLFTWGHQIEGYKGVPGTSSKAPPASGGWTPLSFSAWKRTARNTSLQAPVQYGPAMKDRYGLGFLEPVDRSFFHVTPAGEKLAQALDAQLSKADNIDLLTALDRDRAQERDARELMKHWRIDRPSGKEAVIFRDALFDPTRLAETDVRGRRSAMIQAVLTLLEQSRRPLSEQQIRAGLAWGRIASGREFSLPPPSASIAKHWKVLQIRQAQRVALEGLLAWFEAQLREGVNRLTKVQAALREALLNEPWTKNGTRRCSESLLRFSQAYQDEDDYLAKCAQGKALDLIQLTGRLRDAGWNQPLEAMSQIVESLLGIIMWTRWLLEDAELKRDLRLGEAERISLWHLQDSFSRFADRPFGAWLEDVLERWVIGQHLRMATLRFDGRTQRLRFGFGESGLEFYADNQSGPNLTQDHLAALLSLMCESGLIVWSEKEGNYGLP